MRQVPIIAWSGKPYTPPDLSGIATQDAQGQLKVTPERLSKLATRELHDALLKRLGMGKW